MNETKWMSFGTVIHRNIEAIAVGGFVLSALSFIVALYAALK